MSVIVMGMEMPENCYDCPFVRASWGNDYYCAKGDGVEDNIKALMSKRMDDCPLISIPTPHGRLIDADALINELASEHVGGLEAIKKYTNADTWTAGLHTAWRTIDDAPTVIEAEE